MRKLDLRRMMAVALVMTTTVVTLPLTAADFSTARSVIGSVSAVGPVELRGVGISQEGTLFAGDSIRAGQKGYAKVLLSTGNKIEVAEQTDVNLIRDNQGVKIAMNSGVVGFTARTALRIDVLPFEVIASDDASGNVAIMSAGAAGVRAINGKVTVRNLKTSESFVLLKGQERLLSLKDGRNTPPLAQIASNVPGPIPAPVPAPKPQAPAGKTSGGLGMDKGAWLAVIGGAAVAGVAIWGLVVAMDTRDDIHDLKNTISSTNAANSAALKNVSTASSIAGTVSQQQAQMALVASLAGQAQLALTVAGNVTAAAQAASIASQAAQSQARLNTLQGQIQALQTQLAAGTGSAAQLNTLLAAEETERANSNNLASQLNTLLSANRNTVGVPNTTVGTVGAPQTATPTTLT